jgi:hypothetical protein
MMASGLPLAVFATQLPDDLIARESREGGALRAPRTAMIFLESGADEGARIVYR